MKKTISLLLVLAMVVGVLAVIPMTASAAVKGTIKLSSGTMNVRKSASTSASSIGKLANGDEVQVYTQTTKSGVKWYKITSDKFSNYGYVQAKYVTLNSSSSTTTTTATSATVRTKTMKIYTTKSSKSKLLATAKNGETVSVLSLTSTSAWAKVKYDGVTGYCNKNSLNTSSAGTGTSTSSSAAFISYTKPTTTTYTSKAQVVELLNYNLANFNSSFSFKVSTASASALKSMLPKAKSEVLYGYLLSDEELSSAKLDSVVSYAFDSVNKVVYATVHYNPAGEVLAYYKNGTAVTSTNGKALLSKVQSIIKSEIKSGMSDYDKALALHDYIVLNCGYGTGRLSSTAYGALVNGEAACQGYAEATGLLYTVAGLENYIIRATNKTTDATHGYVKVKISGVWYNVDTTANDPQPDRANRLRHDFFLVSDAVIEQRYTPWLSIYPDATKMTDNYFAKNNLVVSDLAGLKTKVAEAVKAKKTSLEVWVDDYTSGKYSSSAIKSAATAAGAESCSVYTIGSTAIKKISIYMTFTY